MKSYQIYGEQSCQEQLTAAWILNIKFEIKVVIAYKIVSEVPNELFE